MPGRVHWPAAPFHRSACVESGPASACSFQVCGRDTLTKRVRDSPVLTPVLLQRTPASVLCTSTSGARGHAPMAKSLPPCNGRVGEPPPRRVRGTAFGKGIKF
jgi:hypothetical protein